MRTAFRITVGGVRSHKGRENLICIHTGPSFSFSSFSPVVLLFVLFRGAASEQGGGQRTTRMREEEGKERERENMCKKRRNRGVPRVAAPRRWGGAMLNMAPDKAADETISFQCYPLPAALLYTGRPALTAGSSFFFSLSLSLVSYPYSSLFTSSLVLALLSTFPSLPPPKKSTSLIVLSLSSIFILFSFLLDVLCTSSLRYAVKIEIKSFWFFRYCYIYLQRRPGFLNLCHRIVGRGSGV